MKVEVSCFGNMILSLMIAYTPISVAVNSGYAWVFANLAVLCIICRALPYIASVWVLPLAVWLVIGEHQTLPGDTSKEESRPTSTEEAVRSAPSSPTTHTPFTGAWRDHFEILRDKDSIAESDNATDGGSRAGDYWEDVIVE